MAETMSMRFRFMPLALLIALLLLAGCSSSSSTSNVPSGSPGALGATSFAGADHPLIVVVTEPTASGPSEISVLRPDSTSVATIRTTGHPVVATSVHTVLFVEGTRLKQISATGAVSTLGDLPGVQTGQSVVGLAVAPDGGSWLYAVAGPSHDDHGTAYTTELFVGKPGATGTPGSSSSTRFGDLVPFGWSGRGVLIGTKPDKVTATGPFAADDTLHGIDNGYVSLADVHGENMKPLSSGACLFEALAPDGTLACELRGFGTTTSITGSLRLTNPKGGTEEASLPAQGNAGIGFAHYSQDSKQLLLTTAESTGKGYTDRMTTFDVAAKTWHNVGPPHLDSRAWLADRRIVAVDDATVTAPAVKLVGADGKATATLHRGDAGGVITFVGAIYATS